MSQFRCGVSETAHFSPVVDARGQLKEVATPTPSACGSCEGRLRIDPSCLPARGCPFGCPLGMEPPAGMTSEDYAEQHVELQRLQIYLETKHHQEDKEMANIKFISKDMKSPSQPHILAGNNLALMENKLMPMHTLGSPGHEMDAKACTSRQIRGVPGIDFRAVCGTDNAHGLMDGTSEPVDLLAANLEGNLLGLADFAWHTSNTNATTSSGVSANADECVDGLHPDKEDAGHGGLNDGAGDTSCYERPPPVSTSGADWRAVLSLPALEGWLRDAAGRVRALADFMGSDARRATHHVDACLIQLKEICEEIWEHVEVIHALQEAEFPLRLLAVSVQVLLDIQAVHLLWHRLRVSTLLLRERVLRGLQLRATATAHVPTVTAAAANMRGDGAHEQEEEEEQREEEEDQEEEEQSETQLLIRRPADYFSLDCGITASELSAYSPREDDPPSPPSLALPPGTGGAGSATPTRPTDAAPEGRLRPLDVATPPLFDEAKDAGAGSEQVRDSDSDSDSLPLRNTRANVCAGMNAADASYLKMSFFGSVSGVQQSFVDVCGNASMGAVGGDESRSESDISLDEDEDGSHDATYQGAGVEASGEIGYSVASGRAPSGGSMGMTNKQWNDTRDSITTFNTALNAASSVAFLGRPTQIHLNLRNVNAGEVDNRADGSAYVNATEGSSCPGANRRPRDDSAAAQGRACEYFQASSRPKADDDDDEDVARGRSGRPSRRGPSDDGRAERVSNRRHFNPQSPPRSSAPAASESQYCVVGNAAQAPDARSRRDDAYLALASSDAAPTIDPLPIDLGSNNVAATARDDVSPSGESQEYMALPSLLLLREPGFLSLKLDGLDTLLRRGTTGARVCDVSDWELSGTSSGVASPHAFSPVSEPWDGDSSEGKASGRSGGGTSSPAFPAGSPGSSDAFLSDAGSRDSGASSPDGWQAETGCIPSLRQELHRCLKCRGDGRQMEEKIESFVERLLELTSWLQQAEEQAESMGPPRPDTQSLKLYLHNHLSFKMSMESRCVMKDEVVEEGKQFLDLLGARLSGLPGLLGWLEAAWTSLQAHICRQHRWLLAALDVAKAGILASHQARPHAAGHAQPQGEGQLLDLELARDTVEHLSLRLHHERYLGHAQGAARAARSLSLASDARRNDSCEEFGANCLELWDWLCDVEAVMSEDNDLMMSEEHWHQLSKVYRVELTMWLPKKRQIFTQGQELVSLNQTLTTDTVRFKLEQLDAKWNSVEVRRRRGTSFLAAACGEPAEPPACESLSPAAAQLVCRLEGRVRELKAWLRDAEMLVFDGCVERRAPTDLDRQLDHFKSLCHEIRRRRGGVAALVRLCHRLLEGVGGAGDGGAGERGAAGVGHPGADGQNLQLAAVSLERRWEAVVLQAVHWQSRLQRRLNAEQVTLNYVDASQSDLSVSPVEGLEWDETDLGNELSAARAEQPPAVASSTPSDTGKPSAVDTWSMGQSFLQAGHDSGFSPGSCQSPSRMDGTTRRLAAAAEESSKGGRGRPAEPRQADGQDSFSSTDSLLNLLDGLLLAGSGGGGGGGGGGGERSCECESGIASEGDVATTSDSGLLSEVQDLDGDTSSRVEDAAPAYRPDPFARLLTFAGYASSLSDEECDEYLDTGKETGSNPGAKSPKQGHDGDSELEKALIFYDYSYLKEDSLENVMAISDLPTVVIQDDSALDLSNRNKTSHNALTSTNPCYSEVAGYVHDHESKGQLSPISSFMGQHSSNVFQKFELGRMCAGKGDHFDTMIQREDFVNVARKSPRSFTSSCLTESNKSGRSAYLNESSLQLLQGSELSQAAVHKRSDFKESNSCNEASSSTETKPMSGVRGHSWEDHSLVVDGLANRPAIPLDGKADDGRQSGSLLDDDVNVSLIVNTSRASMCSDDEEDDIDLLSSSSTTLSGDSNELEKDSSSNSEGWCIDSDFSDSSSLDDELKDQKFYVTPPWENISKGRPLLHSSNPVLLTSKLYSRFSVSPLATTGNFFGSSFRVEPGSFPADSAREGQVDPLLDDIKNGNISHAYEMVPDSARAERWDRGDPSIHNQTSLKMRQGAFQSLADAYTPYNDMDTKYKYAVGREIFNRGDNYPLLPENVISLTRQREYPNRPTRNNSDAVNSNGGDREAIELGNELSSLRHRASEHLNNRKSTESSNNGLGFLLRDDSDSSLSAHTDEDNVRDVDGEPITPPPDPCRASRSLLSWDNEEARNKLRATEKRSWTRPVPGRGATLNVKSGGREEQCVASKLPESQACVRTSELREQVMGVHSFVNGVIEAAITHIKESETTAPSFSPSFDVEITRHKEKAHLRGESVSRFSQETGCRELSNHGGATEGGRPARNVSGDSLCRRSAVAGAEESCPGGSCRENGDVALRGGAAGTRRRHDSTRAEVEAALSGLRRQVVTDEPADSDQENKTSAVESVRPSLDRPSHTLPAAQNEKLSTPTSSDLKPKTSRNGCPTDAHATPGHNLIDRPAPGSGTLCNPRSPPENSNSRPHSEASDGAGWDVNRNSEEQQAWGGGAEASPGTAARNSPTARKRPQMGTKSLGGGGGGGGGGETLTLAATSPASRSPPSPVKERASMEAAWGNPPARAHEERLADGGGSCGSCVPRLCEWTGPIPPVRAGWKAPSVRLLWKGPLEHKPLPGSPAQMSIAAKQDQNQRNETSGRLSGFPKDVIPSRATGEGGFKKVTTVSEGLVDESRKEFQESLRGVRRRAADEGLVSGAESRKGNLKVAGGDLNVRGRNPQVQNRMAKAVERPVRKMVKRDEHQRHVVEKKSEVVPKGGGVSASLVEEQKNFKNSGGGGGGGSGGGGGIPLTIKGGMDFAGDGDADIDDISKVVASHAGRVWNVGCLIWLMLLLVLWLVAVGPSFIAPSNCMRSRSSLASMGITLSYPWGSPPI
ncbi:unnamed protein product [Lampetra fluviatilis]